MQQLAEAGVDFTAQGEMSEDGYGPAEARLDNIVDALNALRHVVVQVAGGKPGRFEPVKRPTNAIEKYIENQRVRRHNSLLDEVAEARERRKLRSQKAV